MVVLVVTALTLFEFDFFQLMHLLLFLPRLALHFWRCFVNYSASLNHFTFLHFYTLHFAFEFIDERLRGIPEGTDGKNNWHFRQLDNIDVSRLVRTFKVCGDEAIHALIEEKVNRDKLRTGRNGLPWFEMVRFVNTGPGSVLGGQGKGKSVVLFRVDHVVGDGMAMINIFETIATYADGSPMRNLIPSSMGNKFKKKGNLLTGIMMIFKAVASFFKVLTLAASKFDDDFSFRKGIGKNMVSI